ncbi:MAG: hypothetical protein M1401_05730 [Chloroflexi bacterium]|nr:hypothetical protein [Chloroflexota bacterium]
MSLGMLPTPQANTLRFWLVTRERWIRGRLSTTHRRLIDFLNAEDQTPSIVVHGVSLASQPGAEDDRKAPGDAVPASLDREWRGDTVHVNLRNVLFGVVLEGPDAPPAAAERHLWIRKVREPARIGVGPYEIDGQMHLPEGRDPEGGLRATGTIFFAVTDATIRRFAGGFTALEPVVVINREAVDYLTTAVEPALDTPDALFVEPEGAV